MMKNGPLSDQGCDDVTSLSLFAPCVCESWAPPLRLPSWEPLRGSRVQTAASAQMNHFSPGSFYSDVCQLLPTQFP